MLLKPQQLNRFQKNRSFLNLVKISYNSKMEQYSTFFIDQNYIIGCEARLLKF